MSPARKKQRFSNGVVATVDIAQGEGIEPSASTSKAETQELEQKRSSLFVRSLPASTTTKSLLDLFSDAFPVKHATAVVDPSTKQCRGYGFVTFADTEHAHQARAEFNGKLVDGRKLRVEIAEPRHRNRGAETQAESPTARREQKTTEVQQVPKLIVRNLPWTIKSPEHLTKLFQSYGKIKQAYLPKRPGGLLPGFGFVVMRGRKNAEKAIEGVNGRQVDGRTLAVDWAVTKELYEEKAKHAEDVKMDDEEAIIDGEGDGDSHLDTDAEQDGDTEHSSGESKRGSSIDTESVLTSNSVDVSKSELPDGTKEDHSTTLFVRNLPFTCSDEDLEDHFMQFGSVRYARVVIDRETERAKGTGFVCFYNKSDADNCLREASTRSLAAASTERGKGAHSTQLTHSVLQDDSIDPSGRFSLDGRILHVTRAVNRSDADRLTQEGLESRHKRDKDKRRLYLLSEGTISSKSKLWEALPPSERIMREASVKQRKQLIESNPSLHLSLTRLSVRNIPRGVSSKELKALAREAVVGFARDVKAGSRQKLSTEELARGGDLMRDAEKGRKAAGKGVVKQAKVVFESSAGSKISEDTGAGRSRGYGFIEYYTHRSALMGLRWLNGHSIGYRVNDSHEKTSTQDPQDRKKRLVVEFAIENAQVVLRRRENEQKAKERGKRSAGPTADAQSTAEGRGGTAREAVPGKRKRAVSNAPSSLAGVVTSGGQKQKLADEKLAQRNRIIGRKRAARRARTKNQK